jgi:hypothetical protein
LNVSGPEFEFVRKLAALRLKKVPESRIWIHSRNAPVSAWPEKSGESIHENDGLVADDGTAEVEEDEEE